MYPCSICGCVSSTLSAFLRHVALHKNANNFYVKCPFQDCYKKFCKVGSLYSHFCRGHRRVRRAEQESCVSISAHGCDLVCTVDSCIQVCKDYKALIAHLKFHIVQGAKVTCPLCKKAYNKKASFSSHLSRYHGKYLCSVSDVEVQEPRPVSATVTTPPHDAEQTGSNSSEEEELPSTLALHQGSMQESCKNHVSTAFAHLYLRLLSERHVPSSTVQIISEAIYDIQNANASAMASCLKEKLREKAVNSDDIDKLIDETFESDYVLALHRAPDGVFRTEHSRSSFFKKEFLYVSPVEILLGKNKKNKNATFHYVPILSTLEAMLENEDVISPCDRILPETPGVLKDFTDGNMFQSIPLYKEHPEALKLILFQDAFEVVNPIGSAKKKHKLLAVYLILGNLYPWKRYAAHSLKLCLLCNENDLAYFGQAKVFMPLLDDLKKLEAGHFVTSRGMRLFGTVTAILGDNLGSHGIGGFVENFSSASHICRFCIAERADLFSPNALSGISEIRTPANYNSALLALQANGSSIEKGVKFNSLFNQLKYFHVCAPGLPPCLAHDLFEGVVSFDISLYIKHFVTVLKWISLEDLNQRITCFHFKHDDLADRPCEVHFKKALGGHAVQNWNMLRFLPLFLLGSIQSTENDIWQQVLLLSEIVLLVTAHSITLPMVMRLQDLIEDYMTGRAHLFPYVAMKPKHHYLIHYPFLITQFGPLIKMWTMRCESKHSYFRKCARNCQNFRNLTHTLSERHQLYQAYKNTGAGIHGLVNSSSFSSELCTPEIQKEVRDVIIEEGNIFSASQATIRGMLYKQDMLVVMRRTDGAPVFGEIRLILASNGDHFFLLRTVHARYEPAMLFYSIISSDGPFKCMKLESLLDWTPLVQYKLARNKYPVVVLKHAILDFV
nr:uncharacterized protein LOC126537830 isoform X1 [Dermacentor andersoni]